MSDPTPAGYPSHPSMNDADGPPAPAPYGAQPGFPPQPQPGTQQPGMPQPGMQQPGTQQPGMQQPGMQQPGMQQPGMQQPGVPQPGYGPGYPPPGYPPQYGYPGQPGPPPPGFAVPQQRYPAGFVPPNQPWPPPPPPRRGLSPMKLVLIISMPVLLVAGLCAGALILGSRHSSGDSTTSGSPYSAGSRTKVPNYVDERKAAEDAASTAINTALTAQSAGLLSGNKGKFTGVADPARKNAKSYLGDRFASLRALGIAKWDARVADISGSSSSWSAKVKVGYCFAKGCARTLNVQFETNWDLRDKAKPKLTSIYERTPGQASPPWTKSVLRGKTGSRVVVAASGASPSKMSSLLSRAEAAAKVADKFATSSKPGRYVVYFATAKEWRDWPYEPLGDWVGGYAYEESESLVINPKVASSYVPTLLKHELTHVSSLAGRTREVSDNDAWWLNEGLAEYAAEGSKFSSYTARRETVSFLNCCYRDLRVGRPSNSASSSSASGRYGAAYLGVSCLMSKYGRARTLSLFRAVAVDGDPLSSAVSAKLGTSWTSLNKMCSSYMRKVS